MSANTPYVPVTVRVRCLGDKHRIQVEPSGRLTFPDHPHLIREEAAIALGGAPPRCWEVRQAWRESCQKWHSISTMIPPDLRPTVKAAMERQYERRKRGRLAPRWRDGFYRSIEQLARTALDRCAYRQSASQWAGGAHRVNVSVFYNQPYRIEGQSEQVWSGKRRWSGHNSVLTVNLPTTWRHVWNAGLAVFSGCFVLQVLDTRPDGSLIVLAGRQGRGFAIHATRGIVKEGRLQWID